MNLRAGVRSQPADQNILGQDDVRALAMRSRLAEREVAETRDRAALLSDLLAAATSIAAARSVDDIITLLLHATRTSLGFPRAMWFEIETAGAVVIRRVVDGSDFVEEAEEIVEFERRGAMAPLLRRELPWTSGRAGELGSPIVDVRGWYALVPLIAGSSVTSLIYADGHRKRVAEAALIELLASLAAVGSTSIQNTSLLNQMQTLANRDALTGLYNRRAFAERLSARLDAPPLGLPFVFAIVDVDDFKRINDSRGHAVGDAVLKRLARTLLASSRAQDVVGRFAGDEFVVILDGVTDANADAMVGRLSGHLRARGISCSIGAARFPTDGLDAESLFAKADRALYVAKAAGKNRHAL